MFGKRPPRRSKYIAGKVARSISKATIPTIAKTKITPNHLTFMSLLCGIIAGVFYSFGSSLFNILAGLFFAMFFILDHMDGDLARYSGLISVLGELFDSLAGKIVLIIVFFGMCIGQAKIYDPSIVWLLGFVTIGGLFGVNCLLAKRKLLLLKNNIERNKKPLKSGKMTARDILVAIKREITEGMALFSLIVFGSILNKVYYVLLFSSIYVWFYYLVEIRASVKILKKGLQIQ